VKSKAIFDLIGLAFDIIDFFGDFFNSILILFEQRIKQELEFVHTFSDNLHMFPNCFEWRFSK
jgi:hypothetical protein